MTLCNHNIESVADDPVFVAIEQHRSALDALDKIDGEQSEWAELDGIEKTAWAHFVQSIPQTKDGLLAYIGYAAAYPDLMQVAAGTPLDVLQTIETSLAKILL